MESLQRSGRVSRWETGMRKEDPTIRPALTNNMGPRDRPPIVPRNGRDQGQYHRVSRDPSLICPIENAQKIWGISSSVIPNPCIPELRERIGQEKW